MICNLSISFKPTEHGVGLRFGHSAVEETPLQRPINSSIMRSFKRAALYVRMMVWP